MDPRLQERARYQAKLLRGTAHPSPVALAETIEELLVELGKLSDPTAVHVNMLTGAIALPTWGQIKHVYRNDPDTAVAKAGEVLAAVLDQAGERENVQRVEHVWVEKCWIVRWGPFASNSEALNALAALRLITEVSK